MDPTTNGDVEHSSLPRGRAGARARARERLLPALPMSNALVAVGGGFLAGLAARRDAARRSRAAPQLSATAASVEAAGT